MDRYALLIGISQYDGMQDLSKPASDAIAVADYFRKEGWLVERLPDYVTCETLKTKLKTFLQKQAKGQDALIYFTGHGFIEEKSEYERYGYLATSDCQIDMQEGVIVSQQRGISFTYLNGLIKDAQLSSLVVLLDCCHAGSFFKEKLLDQSFERKAAQHFCLIAACRSFQQAYARKSEKHSLFTGALLEGLSEERSVEGEVTVSSLFHHLSRTFKKLQLQEPIQVSTGKDIPLIHYRHKTIALTVSEENPY
jgi:uncharacterized caspase-like protein